MTTPDIMAGLRLADRSLRRYATHMTGGPVDGILHHAYVSAVRWQEPLTEQNRPSISLFQRVHDDSVAAAATADDDGFEELPTALRSVPVSQRSALLLTSLEGLRTAEAAEVLGTTGPAVLDFADSATALIQKRVPALANADLTEISRALGELPVNQASPQFWAEVEAELATDTAPPLSVLGPMIIEPELTATPPPPPTKSFWAVVWAGIVAIAVIALILAFLVTRTGDDEIAAEGTGPTAVTATQQPPVDAETTPPIAPPTSSPPSTAPPATAPPTSAPADTKPPTSLSTTAPPSTAPPTSASADTGGENDRGGLPFAGGLAIVEGSLDAGATDRWQVEVQSGHTLSIAVSAASGIALTVNRSDGTAVPADYADSGMLVFTETGSHVLRIFNGGGSAVAYALGVGLAGARTGLLTNLDEQGVAVSILEMTACTMTSDQLDATLMTSGGVELVVAFRMGTEADTVTWLGPENALGQIQSTNSVPTGLVFTGSITAARDTLLGIPFWLGVYGCDQAS